MSLITNSFLSFFHCHGWYAKSSFAIYLLHQHYYTKTYIFSDSILEKYNFLEIMFFIFIEAIIVDQLRLLISNFIFKRYKTVHDKIINYITIL